MKFKQKTRYKPTGDQLEKKERMLLKNWGITLVIKRIFGFKQMNIISWDKRYHKVFRSEFNPEEYIINKRQKWHRIIDTIIQQSPFAGKILEAGCGTAALSVWLSKKGFKNYAIDEDLEVINIAKELNHKAKANVNINLGNILEIPYPSNSFDVIFSHGTLEHFNKDLIIKAINEGLRIADKYIFGVPTIFDVSNCLRGDEYLTSYFTWREIISKTNGQIEAVYGSFPFHKKLEKINNFLGGKLFWISPTLVFVIKLK